MNRWMGGLVNGWLKSGGANDEDDDESDDDDEWWRLWNYVTDSFTRCIEKMTLTLYLLIAYVTVTCTTFRLICTQKCLLKFRFTVCKEREFSKFAGTDFSSLGKRWRNVLLEETLLVCVL